MKLPSIKELEKELKVSEHELTYIMPPGMLDIVFKNEEEVKDMEKRCGFKIIRDRYHDI